jgi:hypothetical protein
MDVVLDASETLLFRCDSLLNINELIYKKKCRKTSDVHV